MSIADLAAFWIESALVLVAATGLACCARAMPFRPRLQRWLEGTWAGGKPMNCWACLLFWGGTVASLAWTWITRDVVTGQEVLLAGARVLVAVGLGALPLEAFVPLPAGGER